MTKQTASADPAEVTGNPAVTDDTARGKATARVAKHDVDTDLSTVEVTGLHSKALRFEVPGRPGPEHLESLLEAVTGRWQREEDRADLIELHG